MKKKLKKENVVPQNPGTEEQKSENQKEWNTEEIVVESKADQSKDGKKEAAHRKSQFEAETDQKEISGSAAHKRKKWPIIIIMACSFAFLIGIYGGLAIYYQTHFLPGTVINGMDCSGMEAAIVAERLDARIMDYSLEVTGRDYATGIAGASLGTITASDIELSYLATIELVDQILDEQNHLLWVTALFPHEYSYDLVRGVGYNQERLEAVVKSWEALQKKNMVPSQNAYISEYSEELQGYEIIPETSGTELDVELVIQAVSSAVAAQESSLDLDEPGFYKTADITRDNAELTKIVETANRWLGTEIVYDWNGAEVILDLETLKDWVSIVDDEVVLDEEAVSSFVKSQASQYDTYGKNKNIITALGVELTLRSPNYGWRTDTESETAELITLIKEGSSGEREPVYLNKGVQKGTNDIGNSYVEADLTHQHLYLYDKGELILETDFVSGKMIADPGSQTPQGIFALTYKTTNAVLRGQNYATPVNYWMPFYGNYGMHDATWRRVFGGTIYKASGSHGCINLPLDMAAQIYQYVYTGSPVVCYYYPEDLNPVPVTPEPETPVEEIPEEQIPEEQIPEEQIPEEQYEIPYYEEIL